MSIWTVTCDGCDGRWPRVGQHTDHEREAIESRPCPACGAYTLSCPGPKPQAGRRRRGRPVPYDAGPYRSAA